jgi:predicted porin
MKKHLLAIAVASAVAAPALAQNVTISGRMAASVVQEKYTGIGQNQRVVEDPNSRVIFSVTEDLGGGLKFAGQIDMRLSNDTNGVTENASGNNFASLSGNFGRVLVGKHDMHYNEIKDLNAGYATDDGATYRAMLIDVPTGAATAPTRVGGTRVQNLVRYDSPTISGFNATLGFSTNPGADEVAKVASAAGLIHGPNNDQGQATMTIGRYNAGPLSAYFSMYRSKADQSSTTLRSNLFGGSYDLGNGFKVAVNAGETSSQAGVAAKFEKSGLSVPVSYTMGNNEFVFTYGSTDAASGLTASSAKMTNLTLNHYLSKRTTLAVSYTTLTNESGVAYGINGTAQTNLTAGADGSAIALGIRHNF